MSNVYECCSWADSRGNGQYGQIGDNTMIDFHTHIGRLGPDLVTTHDAGDLVRKMDRAGIARSSVPMGKQSNGQLQLSVTRHDNRVESRRVMERLRADARRIALEFGLQYKELRAERPGITDYYGVCHRDGCIRIRLRHAVTGRVLRYSSLIDTVCHELAHLRHFNHGERFQGLYEEMLEWSRQQGIYRPAKPRPRESLAAEPPSEVQLPLFGDPELRSVIAGNIGGGRNLNAAKK